MHNLVIKTIAGAFFSAARSLLVALAMGATISVIAITPAHGAPRLAGLLDGLPQVPEVPGQTSGPQTDFARPAKARAAARISPAEAAQQAREQHGGKVLSVDLERGGSDPQYRVKIIDNGNVRVVRVPAN